MKRLRDAMPVLNSSHQIAEPIKTPSAKMTPLYSAVVMPSPAKIAKKDKIVTGFVIVKNKVERYAFNGVLPRLAFAASCEGFARSICTQDKVKRRRQ